MPGSRGFFYDECNSGDRLTREWLQSTPAAWRVDSVTPHRAYKYTTVGAIEYNTLMSQPDKHDFEAEMLFYASNADAMVGLTLRKARNVAVAGDTGQICFWLTAGLITTEFTTSSGATPVLSTAVYVVDTTKWHRMRTRVVGRNYKCKVWVEGTAEPDWMISQNVRYTEMRNRGVIALRGGIRTAWFSGVKFIPIPVTGAGP